MLVPPKSRERRYQTGLDSSMAPRTQFVGRLLGLESEKIYKTKCTLATSESTCLNNQCVATPDGLAMHFWKPVEGKQHDITLLRMSKLAQHFDERSDLFGGYVLYGDLAYRVQKYTLSGFNNACLTETEKLFNTRMSAVRESVAWMFAHLKGQWAFIDYMKSLMLR
ncbi:unnamed protein product [Phytophthora fragariaefolia]|uniref:Unnamed protein product n=1 Tax=Phytophthora fragariaefolia TaxID=1490495 RepID=A0A9W7CWQ5_9STRA|nr:unnamed protein product [Phytophthora fragariaefolia]